jgi:hypothetical protein
MFESTATASIIPIQDPEISNKSKSTGYNWKTLTKAGLVFVTTTGAFLVLKATGSFSLVSSWLKSTRTNLDEQGTRFAAREVTGEIEAYSEYSDFKESSLATVRDFQHIAFMPQRTKRNPTETLEKIGPEFQVNTYTASGQGYPSVAGLNDGKFVVTWHGSGIGDSGGIYCQMYNSDCSKHLSEFQVNTYATLFQQYPSVAELSDSKFVVTWDSYDQDGDFWGVYGQMYNADGTRFLSEFRVNTFTTSYQMSSSVAGLSDSKFVVTWVSLGQDGDGYGIYGQMYNADASKYSSEFRVNTYTTSTQVYPSVAGLSDGKFVVTWMSLGQDGDGYGIYGQQFNIDGSKFLSEFQVNTYTIGDQEYPAIAGLNDGKFVVTWQSNDQDGDSYGIYAQMFTANGTKFLSEFRVNTYTINSQEYPSIVELSDGKFVITWQSNGQDGSGIGVYGQIFNINGTKFFSEFQVNTFITNKQERSSVAGLADGKFVVTWQSEQDGDSYGIYGQMFSTRTSGSERTESYGFYVIVFIYYKAKAGGYQQSQGMINLL